jgi:hypothetical protein
MAPGAHAPSRSEEWTTSPISVGSRCFPCLHRPRRPADSAHAGIAGLSLFTARHRWSGTSQTLAQARSVAGSVGVVSFGREAPVSECVRCGAEIGDSFRYCPWCGWTREPKVSEFFHPHAVIERNRGGALRVSRYQARTPPMGHVRFSVWNKDGEAEAAISIDEPEARRLARFLREPERSAQPSRLQSLLESLRGSLLRTS